MSERCGEISGYHDLIHDICVPCLNSVILSKGNDKWLLGLVLSSKAFKVDCRISMYNAITCIGASRA